MKRRASGRRVGVEGGGGGLEPALLQMNGDRSARAIDPLVKAARRLQPNALKKETPAPAGVCGREVILVGGRGSDHTTADGGSYSIY